MASSTTTTRQIPSNSNNGGGYYARRCSSPSGQAAAGISRCSSNTRRSSYLLSSHQQFSSSTIARNTTAADTASTARKSNFSTNNLQQRRDMMSSSTTDTTTTTTTTTARAYVAVGSNLGNRFENIQKAMAILQQPPDEDNEDDQEDAAATATTAIRLLHTSMLHETAPMYVTDQPSFLNGVVVVETKLQPHDLLKRLKQVEVRLGRDLHGGIRNGPRPVDLDIIFYSQKQQQQSSTALGKEEKDDSSSSTTSSWTDVVMETPELIIPHPRMSEREFVLAPLCEVASITDATTTTSSIPGETTGSSMLRHPVLGQSVQDLYDKLMQKSQQENQTGNSNDKTQQEEEQRVVVLPLPRDRMLYFNETLIMGILNVTPDSFSDGGKWFASNDDDNKNDDEVTSNEESSSSSVAVAVQHALQMEQDGASIIDIGGESTRPGAKEVLVEEELRRTIPVIEQIRKVSDIPISIDTRHSIVALEAVRAGADIVNDVSGGTFDPDMLSTVADLGNVPIVLMHMRGTPETMQSYASDYGNVLQDVTSALLERCAAAEAAGIPRWMQIVDPGIGFAKDLGGNVSLLQNVNTLRSNMGMSSTPILLGTSRKGFLGKLTGVEKAEDRDYGTIASCVAALCLVGGVGPEHHPFSRSVDTCNILRVHNVKAMKEAALVMDAIKRQRH